MIPSTPIPFNGATYFTFNFDKEIDVIAENGAKGTGGGTVTPVTITPVKVEYGMRVSDEFVTASEEEKLDYLKAFNDGFAAKLAKGFDIMGMHGYNPRTGSASTVIGDNHLDKKITNAVEHDANDLDVDIESAIELVSAADYTANGIVVSNTARSELASLKTTDGARRYPELTWGAIPPVLNGLAFDANATVDKNDDIYAYVGDFSVFKWGYAKDIEMEVIEYGNPDNDTTAGDLKGHNQVYLRAEAFIGWGILDPKALALVKAKASA